MFLFEAHDFLEELKIHEPLIYSTCANSSQQASDDGLTRKIPKNIFSQCPSISVDNAIMEKTLNAIMVQMEGSWSDLGSWNSVWEHLPKDKDNNVLSGNIKAFDTSNSLIFSKNKLSVSFGIDNIVVIDTKDALLIANKDKIMDFKSITESIKETNQEEFESHVKVHRPWGYYESLDVGEGFQVKRLTVYPKQKLSVQKHKYRSEHWVVVSGEAQVLKNEETFTLKQNESTYIPSGCIHSLENKYSENLTIIEVQSGSYLGEDDIIRLEDRYGRIDNS
jgi:mannose-1-phosphate guanylyltransferase/mannose-6-phosphate isomerase